MWRSYYSALLSAVSWTPEPLGEKKKIRALRGSAAIPICLPVKNFFFFSRSHLLTSWGTHRDSLFLPLTFTSVFFIITAHGLPLCQRPSSAWMDSAFSHSSSCTGEMENKVRILLRADNRGVKGKMTFCSRRDLLILCGDQPNVVHLAKGTQCSQLAFKISVSSVVDQLPIWIRRHEDKKPPLAALNQKPVHVVSSAAAAQGISMPATLAISSVSLQAALIRAPVKPVTASIFLLFFFSGRLQLKLRTFPNGNCWLNYNDLWNFPVCKKKAKNLHSIVLFGEDQPPEMLAKSQKK